MEIRINDDALAEDYAVSSTTLVVMEVCLSHVRLTSVFYICDMEHRMLTIR